MMNLDTHQTSNPQNATPSQPDPRVATALEEIRCSYEYSTEEASFYIPFKIDDHRSQGIHVSSGTHLFMGVEMRRIFSIGVESDGPFDRRTANLLIRENAKHFLGSWSIVPDEGIHYAIFSMVVAAVLDARKLGSLIEIVAHTADAMEYRLTGLDEF